MTMSEKNFLHNLEQNDLLRLFRWHQLDSAEGADCGVVPVGSYAIKRTATGFLTAALGSAVGVALYDRQAGIGGVASFLLAAPRAEKAVGPPEIYVETGLPAFIQ